MFSVLRWAVIVDIKLWKPYVEYVIDDVIIWKPPFDLIGKRTMFVFDCAIELDEIDPLDRCLALPSQKDHPHAGLQGG